MEIPDMRESLPYLRGEKKYVPKPIEGGVMMYDATQTFKYILDKEKLKRLGGNDQPAAFDKLIKAVDGRPKAFFWAFLDKENNRVKIDVKAQTPVAMW